ncbi:MAG: flippase [Deltaproteobacteria bacterium]|nr:flippase [Deltaproteobacteria bacterium]
MISLYLARVLGVAGFGQFSLAVAAGMYMWAVVDMGVAGYGVREVARSRGNASEILNVLNSMRLVIAIILLIILTLVLSISEVHSETRFVIIFGCFYVVASALSPDWVFRGLERMEYIALSNTALAVTFLAAILVFVKSPADTIGAVFYRSASFFIATGIALIMLKKKENIVFSFKLSISKWRLHVKESFYFAVVGAFNIVALYIPLFFLGAWAGMEEVGIFSAPQRIITAIIMLPAIITAAAYPTLSNLFAADKEKFNRAHKSFERLMLFIGVPIGAMGTLLSKKIVITLFGSSYSAGSAMFGVMIWYAPLMFVKMNYGVTLSSAGFYRLNMLATGSGALTTVLICFLLIPSYGGIGASFSLVGGELVALIVMGLIFVSKVHRVHPFDLYLLKVSFASVVAGIAVAAMDMSLGYAVITGTVFYLGISVALGLITVGQAGDIYRKVMQGRFEAV